MLFPMMLWFLKAFLQGHTLFCTLLVSELHFLLCNTMQPILNISRLWNYIAPNMYETQSRTRCCMIISCTSPGMNVFHFGGREVFFFKCWESSFHFTNNSWFHTMGEADSFFELNPRNPFFLPHLDCVNIHLFSSVHNAANSPACCCLCSKWGESKMEHLKRCYHRTHLATWCNTFGYLMRSQNAKEGHQEWWRFHKQMFPHGVPKMYQETEAIY